MMGTYTVEEEPLMVSVRSTAYKYNHTLYLHSIVRDKNQQLYKYLIKFQYFQSVPSYCIRVIYRFSQALRRSVR